jgi:hypothetical protein
VATSDLPQPGTYFERIDEHRYRPTAHAGGDWNPEEVHFSALAGLLVHALERDLAAHGGRGLLLSRITLDILGRLAGGECEIHVEVVRPGRTIELVSATVTMGGRAVVTARAWFLGDVDTSAVAGGHAEALPSPDGLEQWPFASLWPGGFVASLDVRQAVPPVPGRTTAWLRTPLGLVAGEPASDLASFFTLVDTANGIAARQPPSEWMFPNVDLTVHLHRLPAGDWVGLDSTAVFGASGQGVTSTVLHDLAGPVGHAQQSLTVRPRPRA